MTAVAAFQLTAPTTQAAPFTLGHAFRQGDVPSGSQVVANIPAFQCAPKNAWPDGSLKFAVLSGVAALTSNTDRNVALSVGTSTGGTALTAADLKATGVVAAVGAGAFGSVSWATTDWDVPFMAWISGPQMSSWIFRKPIGSDPHLVAWLEVRLYAGGAVEVLPWIENGYIRVAGPTSKSATYTFSLGGTQRFSAVIDLPSQARTPLVSGALLSHWLGADPGVIVQHDKTYMQSTTVVPTYGATVSPTNPIVTSLPSAYTPMQQGNYSNSMGQTGYQSAIGLLPQWDAIYLNCIALSVSASLQRNAYSAGRFSIHFRDENTNRPLRFDQYPNLSVNASTISDYPPTPTGTVAPGWDVMHHPSLGFMAYLVTGRWYHMETVLFTATMNYLCQVDNQRQYAGGVFLSNSGAATERGAAWGLRTLAQAACVTPDSDTLLRTQFLNSVVANINHYYPMRLWNPYGIIPWYANYVSGSGTTSVSPWMNDFFTAATGYMLAMGLAIPSGDRAKLVEFFAWKAQTAIGRLGRANVLSDWSYRDAAIYQMPISPFEGTSVSDPATYYPGWQAMYEKSREGQTPSQNTDPDGNLRGGNFPEGGSYWGILSTAIAYAEQHDVADAAAARARMTTAPNYNLLQAAFADNPEWAIAPQSYATTGAPMTTPGPSILMDSESFLASGIVMSPNRGLGIKAADIPTGFPLPPFLLNDIVSGGNVDDEYAMEIMTGPGGGTLNGPDELSAFSFSGPDGYYAGTQLVKINGVATPTTYSFTIGSPTSTVTGVSITPNTAIIPGGTTLDFDASVAGAGSPSQAVTWTATLATVDSLGVVTAAAGTNVVQTGTLTARSVQDTGWSATISFTIPIAGDTTKPVMVGSLSADTITVDGFGLSWPAATDDTGIAEYRIVINGVSESLGLSRTYSTIGRPPNTRFDCVVTAYDAAGNPAINPLSLAVTTLALTIAPPPTPAPTLPDPTPPATTASRDLSWLKQAVENWTHRTGFAADPILDDFIMLAEKRINNDLEARLQDAVVTIPTVANLNGVLMPADVAEIRSLSCAHHGPLGYITPDQFNEEFACGAAGPTKFYTIVGPYIYLGPTPDAVYSLKCAYRQHIPSLLDAVDGVNWLIRDQPNIYLAATMCEALVYAQNETQIPVWEAKYKVAVEALNHADWHTGGPLTVKSDTLH